MTREPIWIIDDVALAVHKRQLVEHGGLDGIRDISLLESALQRPKNIFFYSDVKPSIARMAASYAAAIIHNHPFVDGNKRVGFVLSMLFLNLNNYDIEVSQAEKYNQFMLLASDHNFEAEFANFLESNLVKHQTQPS